MLSGPGALVIPKLSSHLLYLLCRRGRGGSSCGCWLCCRSFFFHFESQSRSPPSSRVHTSLASWNLSFCSPVCFPFLLFPYRTSVVITFTLFGKDLSVVCANLSLPSLSVKAQEGHASFLSTEAGLSSCFQSLRCLFPRNWCLCYISEIQEKLRPSSPLMLTLGFWKLWVMWLDNYRPPSKTHYFMPLEGIHLQPCWSLGF